MINTPENPPQDVIQERVKRDPALCSSARRAAIAARTGFVIVHGLASPRLP